MTPDQACVTRFVICLMTGDMHGDPERRIIGDGGDWCETTSGPFSDAHEFTPRYFTSREEADKYLNSKGGALRRAKRAIVPVAIPCVAAVAGDCMGQMWVLCRFNPGTRTALCLMKLPPHAFSFKQPPLVGETVDVGISVVFTSRWEAQRYFEGLVLAQADGALHVNRGWKPKQLYRGSRGFGFYFQGYPITWPKEASIGAAGAPAGKPPTVEEPGDFPSMEIQRNQWKRGYEELQAELAKERLAHVETKRRLITVRADRNDLVRQGRGLDKELEKENLSLKRELEERERWLHNLREREREICAKLDKAERELITVCADRNKLLHQALRAQHISVRRAVFGIWHEVPTFEEAEPAGYRELDGRRMPLAFRSDGKVLDHSLFPNSDTGPGRPWFWVKKSNNLESVEESKDPTP